MDKDQLTVLLVEDDVAHAELVKRVFQAQKPTVELIIVSTLPQTKETLAERSVDIVVTDFQLPDEEGSTLLLPPFLARDYPIIIMTSFGDEQRAVEAIKAGALDYVIKSETTLADMPRIVERGLREWHHNLERKQTEAELRRRELQLSETQRLAGLGSWEWDVRSNAVTWSDELYRIYGLNPTEFGASFEAYLARVHPEDREYAKSTVEQALNSQSKFYFEERIIRPDGQVRVLYSSGNVVTDETGGLPRLIGTCIDITERKRAEETLQYRLNMERLVSNISTEFINLPVDKIDTGITRALGTLAKFTGTVRALVLIFSPDTSSAIVSQEWYDSSIETENESAKGVSFVDFTYFWDTLEQRKDIIVQQPGDLPPEATNEHQWLTQNGFRPLLFTPMLLNEELYGTVGIVDRIDTDREWPESFLPLLKLMSNIFVNALERKRAEETRQTLEIQLRHSQKMETIGTLTAGIAHDFNNMLTAINGFAELMQHRISSEDSSREMLDMILFSGQRASDLVRQLLIFSRKQRIEPKVLNLNTVVTDLDKILRKIIGENINLSISLVSNPWLVEVDPSQISQAVVNLAVNARDAMPTGGQLIIRTENVILNEDFVRRHLGTELGPHVLLTVSDTGHGMNKEIQEHVFEPFFTTKEAGKGSGLGLSTVFGIVKQSRGNVWIESREGFGTTFKIYIPRIEQNLSNAHTLEEELLMPFGQETILLVEDDMAVRGLTRMVLQEQGYNLLEAEDSSQALDLVNAEEPQIDLLLTDVVMPGMSGIVLAERLIGLYPKIKTLYMSGYSDILGSDTERLDQQLNLLQKPFHPATLVQMVRSILDGQMS